VTIGAVLDEAWTLYTRFFLRFFALALVVFAAVNLLYALVVEAVSSDDGGTAIWLALVGLATAVVGTTWLQGALVYAVQDARDGTFDATIGQVFARVSPSLVPLLVAGFLAGLGVAIGLVLLIVPGLFLMTVWAVIAPVIVLEKQPPFGAFGRSRELVRGHGWTVFGIVVITALLTGVASGILQAVFSFLPRFLEILVGGTVAQAIVAPFSAIALAVTYFRLRGVDGEPASASV
jgi:hypothetical protein